LRERYQATGWGKWVAALWAGLTVLRRNPFMGVRILVDGQAIVRRTSFVFVGNNEYRMVGLNAGARDSLATGRLALYVLNGERRLGLLQLAWQVVRKGVDEVKELDLLTVDDTRIETRRRRLQIALDGEVVPLESPLDYRIRPAALRVYVPRSTSACYPHATGTSSTRA
jgi:diacylglycerol kinase family enzyme